MKEIEVKSGQRGHPIDEERQRVSRVRKKRHRAEDDEMCHLHSDA
jgi:hypothetical protein